MWAAVRSLLRQARIGRRAAENAERAGRLESAGYFWKQAEEAEKHAAIVRQLIIEVPRESTPD